MFSLRKGENKTMKAKKKIPLLVLFGGLAIGSFVSANSSTTNNDMLKLLGNPKVADNGGTYYSAYSSQDEVLKAGDLLAEEVADEGMVLLKNDGKLPWSGVKNVSIFGCVRPKSFYLSVLPGALSKRMTDAASSHTMSII